MFSGKKQYRPTNDKAIIPMTLFQIHHDLIQDSTFDGQPFDTIAIVGRLKQFHRANISNIFVFNDGTGVVQGRINLNSGKMPAFAENISFEHKEGEYFFVVLKPRFADVQKKFYIQMIKEITDYNQITKHFSDVILSALIRRKG